MTSARRCAMQMIAILAFGALPVSSTAQAAFDGVYVAHGVDSDGNEYRRAVDIEQRGDQFIVTWVSARVVGEAVILEPTWLGVGLATGQTLSVSFVAEDTFGIIVYQADDDGQRLSGLWTLADDDGALHSETLIRMPDVLTEPTTVEPHKDQ